MPKPTEHKSVQSRILHYATEIGWTFVSQTQAEQRRCFDTKGISPRERAKKASRFFTGLLYEKVKQFNPLFRDSKEDLISQQDILLPDIYGNRTFLQYLQGEKTFFSKNDNREYNLILVDYDHPENNIFEVTEEYYLFNG